MADVTSIYGNPIKDAVARADIATNTQDISDLKDGLSESDNYTMLNAGGIINVSSDGDIVVPLSTIGWEQGRINSSGVKVITAGYRTVNFVRFASGNIMFVDDSGNSYRIYLAQYNPETQAWIKNIVSDLNTAVTIDTSFIYRIVCYIDASTYPVITGTAVSYSMSVFGTINGTIAQIQEDLVKDVVTATKIFSDYGVQVGGISSSGTNWNSRGGYRTTGYIEFPVSKITINDTEAQANCAVWLYRYEKGTHNFVSPLIQILNLSNNTITIDTTYEYRVWLLNTADNTASTDPTKLTFTYVKSSGVIGTGLQPTVTWIDDNGGTSAEMSALSDLLDELSDSSGNRMKITLAVDTAKLTTVSGYADNLKAFQEKGCHIANHGGSWQDWIDHYNSSSQSYSPDDCESSVIKGNVSLYAIGILEPDYFIYPGGHTDSILDQRVKKWCKCGVLAGESNGICHMIGDGRFRLKRCFIRTIGNETAAEAETRIKGYIDSAYAGKDWLIFGTHSGTPSEFNHDLCVAVIQYAQTKGMVFRTLNEAYKERALMFEISENP